MSSEDDARAREVAETAMGHAPGPIDRFRFVARHAQPLRPPVPSSNTMNAETAETTKAKTTAEKDEDYMHAGCTSTDHMDCSAIYGGGPLFAKYREAVRDQQPPVAGWCTIEHEGYSGERAARYGYNNTRDLDRLCLAVRQHASQGVCSYCLERDAWSQCTTNPIQGCKCEIPPKADRKSTHPPSRGGDKCTSVSYTHLTLPTKRIV